MAAPTTDSRLRSLLAAPSARRVAHRCGARETDCFPCHARAVIEPTRRTVIEPTRLIRHPVCAGHARAESDVAPCKKKISSNIIWTQSSHRRRPKQSLSSPASPCGHRATPPSRQCTPLTQATDSSARVSPPSSSATMAGHVKKFMAQSGQQKLGTPFSSLALSPRSPPPARHTPPKAAAPSPSVPDSAASLGRLAWQAAVRGVS
eukprot:COSAG05_NODE_319_length_11483_cov_406.525604_3_plen_205_part_00